MFPVDGHSFQRIWTRFGMRPPYKLRVVERRLFLQRYRATPEHRGQYSHASRQQMSRMPVGVCAGALWAMTGRVVIVTGASSGLGYETARYLCEGGNDVVLACRDEDKAKRAVDKIKQQNPNALATYIHVRRHTTRYMQSLVAAGWLGSRVVSVLDSGAVGPGFNSQPRRCRVTVLGKLSTPIVPLFTKQQNW